jgi:hypothetical protein
VVCPGHGPKADATLLEDQQTFFAQLRERVGALVRARNSPREIYQAMDQIRDELVAQARIARYVSKDGLPVKATTSARLRHRYDHALGDARCEG